MKYPNFIPLMIGLTLTGCTGIEQTINIIAQPVTTSAPTDELPDASANSIQTSPACVFSDAILNGLSSSDSARTNYSCQYDGGPANDRVIHVFFADGSGRLQSPSTGPVESTTWTLNTSECSVTISVGGSPQFKISSPTLNSDDTIASATSYNFNTGVTKTLTGCVYDATPGQVF